MLCRFCGGESTAATLFDAWVKPTFTDHDKLLDGDGICRDCLFWFNERSEKLAALVGKDKPQRMRNYSHFIQSEQWIPLSKGNKQRMQEILLTFPFPALAAIADSGQKHIVFRARRNPPESTCGWIQFEEQSLFIYPQELKDLLKLIEELYAHFSKGEIERGDYKSYRVMSFGVELWQKLEEQINPRRSGLLFKVALFLAQRKEDGKEKRASDGLAMDGLARNTTRLQKPLSSQHLDAVRGPCEECGVHKQPGQVCQLTLFELECDNRQG